LSDLASVETLFRASDRQAFQGVSITKDRIFLSYLDEVKGRVAELAMSSPKAASKKKRGAKTRVVKTAEGAQPSPKWILKAPIEKNRDGSMYVSFADYRESLLTLSYSDFITPNELLVSEEGTSRFNKLRQLPPRFDASGVTVTSLKAMSKDGEQIPYFLVLPSKTKFKGPYPTLIYAYGGFEIPSVPGYLGATGKAWVEKGGAYVLANIRGGGEFGPRWHEAARKIHRHRAFDDLFAVAEALISTGVTTSAKLGVRGGSNGGLLTGVALTQRPDLFSAVLSQVPLLDMTRFHKLLAGNSWMDEYGNPDIPDERKAIDAYSPYQNVKRDIKYPEVFFTTSTRDDRVHPGHARRMVAKMESMGHSVLYFENTDGGHAGAAQLKSKAKLTALEYRYLWTHLGSPQNLIETRNR